MDGRPDVGYDNSNRTMDDFRSVQTRLELL